jgi:hypothetical protein
MWWLKLRDLYSSSSILRLLKSRLELAGNVARVEITAYIHNFDREDAATEKKIRG